MPATPDLLDDLPTLSPDSLLLVIDGTNLLRTIYEADRTEDGPEKADRWRESCRRSFARALKEHPASHVALVFDVEGSTWRHRLHEGYQADRKPQSGLVRELMASFIAECPNRFGLRPVMAPDVDADDVIATLVYRWHGSCPHPVHILSSDKDMYGLVTPEVVVYNHFDRENPRRDEAYVRRRYGVEPYQFRDYLALVGDASDGIPGVPSVGPKTAARLLEQHGTLDRILELDRAKADKDAAKVLDSACTAELSRRLATMLSEVRTGLSWKDLEYHPRGPQEAEGGAPRARALVTGEVPY